MVKGGKNESNTFGEGWERFPPLFPLQNAGFGGSGGWRPAAAPWTHSGRGGVRERKGGWGRRGRHGPGYWPRRASPHGATGLSRQCMWRDSEGHVIAVAAQRWLGPPAWPHCRATCNGATEAICRAMRPSTTKRATPCK